MNKFIKAISASLVLSMCASAFGVSYVASDDITKKEFLRVDGETYDCDQEIRIYGNGSETRHRTVSDSDQDCYTQNFYFDKTSDSFALTMFEQTGDISKYTPSLPFIQADMSLGANWETQLTSPTESLEQFEVTAIDNLILNGGNFTSCPKLTWTRFADTDYAFDVNIWFCKDMGVVKWTSGDETWELENFETDALTVVKGSTYLQDDKVSAKTFVNKSALGAGCDQENRTFSGTTENRTYSNSLGEEIACDNEVEITNKKTDDTHTLKSQIYNGYNIDYNSGLPIIVTNMAIGESWGQRQYVYLNDAYVGTRSDTFTLEEIENISVDAGDYSQCMKVDWVGYSPIAGSNFEMKLWLCPGIGLVKYIKDGSSWEMTSITPTDAGIEGEGEGEGEGEEQSTDEGSGGGGSLPLFLMLGFALFFKKK